jgi:hypothetical protein
MVDRLTFAWWNTGLSPVGRPQATPEDFLTATLIVKSLLQDMQVDCLGLGEVTKTDLDQLLLEIGLPHYATYDGTLREGRLQFDTAAIFNAECLTRVGDVTSIDRHGNRSLKLANRIDFVVPGDPNTFHVFISHWPSHPVPDSESLRIRLGTRLREVILNLMTLYDGDARLIVMGDFNEEPFHESLEGQLLATRDRKVVQNSPSYLYNPFWRCLGESHPYDYSRAIPSFAGTCYVASGHSTKWKTVDQIIFSAAFVGRSEWHLKEELTKIMHITPRVRGRTSSVDIFNHFPVIATIEKVVNKEGEDDG